MATSASKKKKPESFKKLKEKLLFKKKSAWDGIKVKDRQNIFDFCEELL